MSIGLTVGNLMEMWKTLPADTVVEVSCGGMEGLVVRSASVDYHNGGAHLTAGTITVADVRRYEGQRARGGK